MWSLLTSFGTGFKRKKNTSLAPPRGNFYKHQQAQITRFLSAFNNRKIESFQNTRIKKVIKVSPSCEIGLNMLPFDMTTHAITKRKIGQSWQYWSEINRMSFVLKYTFQSFLSNLTYLFKPFCNVILSKGKLCHFSMKLKCHKNILKIQNI